MNTLKRRLFASMAIASMLTISVWAQDIYKYLDENGSVVYTTEPRAGAERVNLKEISVVSTRKYEEEDTSEDGAPVSEAPESEAITPAEARRLFSGIELTSPGQDQTIWGAENAITASVRLPNPLLPGYQIRFSVNGLSVDPSPSTTHRITGIERGSHTVTADVIGPNGDVVASAEPRQFHMRQWSVNNPALNNSGNNSGGNNSGG